MSRRAPAGLATQQESPNQQDSAAGEHFRTDFLLGDLKRRTIASAAVTVSSQFGKFVLTIVFTAILARLLTPTDFGVFALVTTVSGVMRVFREAGLSTATVQRETITHAQVSNLFWINVAVSGVSTLALIAIAPLLALAYDDARLLPITVLLSTTFLISGFAIQHQALLRRQMRFKALALIDLGSISMGTVIAIAMAWLGFRYWSLVAHAVSIEATALVLTWSVSRWRPQRPVRGSGTRPLLSFGAARTAGDFTLALARGSDNLLLGRAYSAETVGLYSRASALLIQPLQQFLTPINAVFMPALSRVQTKPERYRLMFLEMYECIALASCFFTGLLLALARPVTLVLLGPQWEHAAPIFAGFTLAALCIPLANASAWLFLSQGRGTEMLVAQATYSGAMVLTFAAALPFGAIGMAIAFSLSNLLIRMPVYYYAAGRRGPVSTTDLWQVFGRHVPVWGVVFGVTFAARLLAAGVTPVVELMISVPAGLVAGTAMVLAIPPYRRVAANVFQIIRETRQP